MKFDFRSQHALATALLAAIIAVLFLGCGHSTETIVAEVEGRRLALRDLVPERGADSASLTRPVLMDRMLRWVNREALYREAMRRGIDKDPRVIELLQDAERKILVDQLRLSLRDSVPEPSEANLHDYYRQHSEEFLRNRASYRLSYVLARTPKEITSLRELVKGIGIEKARNHLDSAGIPQPPSPADWVEGDSCFAADLPSAQIGVPTTIRSCFGGLVFAVVSEKQDSGTVKPFAEVQAELKERVREADLASQLEAVLVEAKSRVVISTDLAPFQQYPDSLETK